MISDTVRLARRTAALHRALASLDGEALDDDEVVARVVVAPGFRPVSPPDPLQDYRRVRQEAMVAVLGVVAAVERVDTEVLAGLLTEVRPTLAHPMTGEPLCLLDWVNRGGDTARAVGEVAGSGWL